MYAIVEQGGNQHKVREGDVVQIDSPVLKPGDTFTFDRVLFYTDEAGDVRVGTPELQDVAVVGTVKRSVKGPKVMAIRFKRRKGVRTRHGHRQVYQQVRIDRITAEQRPGTTEPEAEETEKEPVTDPTPEPEATELLREPE